MGQSFSRRDTGSAAVRPRQLFPSGDRLGLQRLGQTNIPPYDLDNLIPADGRLSGHPLPEGGDGPRGWLDRQQRGRVVAHDREAASSIRIATRLSRVTEIESRLLDLLGVEKVLWLGDGIVGDDTDGHIDDITRFVGPSTCRHGR